MDNKNYAKFINFMAEMIEKYAKTYDINIIKTYEDKGKSGKSIDGRDGFIRMLNDIESGAIKVAYVLVFKLSRFGRNVADTLNSLQRRL